MGPPDGASGRLALNTRAELTGLGCLTRTRGAAGRLKLGTLPTRYPICVAVPAGAAGIVHPPPSRRTCAYSAQLDRDVADSFHGAVCPVQRCQKSIRAEDLAWRMFRSLT